MKLKNTLFTRGINLSIGLTLLLCCTGATAHNIKTIDKYVRVFVDKDKVISGIADGRWVKGNGSEGKIEATAMVCFVHRGECTEGMAILFKDGRLRSHFRHYEITGTDAASKTVNAVSHLPLSVVGHKPYEVYELYISDNGFVKRTKSIIDGEKKTIVETAVLK